MTRHALVFSSALVLGLVGACSATPTTARISRATGGTVTAGTHSVVIPAMSLPTDTDVSLVTAPASTYLALENGRPEVLRMEPEGTVLEVAASVTIRADFIDAGATDTVSVFQLEMIDGVRWRPLASERSPAGDVTVSVSVFAPLGVAVVPAATGSGVTGIIRWGDATPVAGAPIQLYQGTTLVTSTTSSATGAYAFTDVAPGDYRVVVMYECSIDRAVTVTAGAPTTLDLILCGG